MLPPLNECKIGIIGLGYVGLPLACEFAKNTKCLISNKSLQRKVIGFDINYERIKQLNNSIDETNQISKNELKNLDNILFTSFKEELIDCEVFIVTVPTHNYRKEA